MKLIPKIVVNLFILFSFNIAFAQYGNGYGNNGYGNDAGYGNNRMNQTSQMDQESQHESEKAIPVEVTVAKIMAEMTPEINLDELQQIAISNVLKESLNNQGRILKQSSNQEDQLENFKILAETTDRKILEFLNKDQKEKYLIFKEESKSQKKSKSKKKQK
jgi:hypothetical protein